jgi:cytochrome d ubiquinol oxidase subunit I
MLTLAAAVIGLWLRRGNCLYEARWFQRLVLFTGPSGIVALLVGWITTEVGRQPWTVYGVQRTADAVSSVSAQQAGVSLLVLVIVFCLVFGTGVFYMLKLMARGPIDSVPASSTDHSALSNRALAQSVN